MKNKEKVTERNQAILDLLSIDQSLVNNSF